MERALTTAALIGLILGGLTGIASAYATETRHADPPATEAPQDNETEAESDIDRAIQRFREAAEVGQKAVEELGREAIGHLRQAHEELAKRYETLSPRLQKEWEETRESLEDLNAQAVAELRRLAESADHEWQRFRVAAGEALQRLADRLDRAAERARAPDEPKPAEPEPHAPDRPEPGADRPGPAERERL